MFTFCTEPAILNSSGDIGTRFLPSVIINRPRNVPGATGHYQYRGSAPIFATSKLMDLEKLEDLSADDPRTGAPRCTEASMVFGRLKVFEFHHRVSKPAAGNAILWQLLRAHVARAFCARSSATGAWGTSGPLGVEPWSSI